jgi:hypothetical protein
MSVIPIKYVYNNKYSILYDGLTGDVALVCVKIWLSGYLFNVEHP